MAIYRAFLETAEAGRATPVIPPAPAELPAPVAHGMFSSPGGLVSVAAPAQLAPAAPPGPAGVAAVEAPTDRGGLATTRVSTIGRHWSGGANAAMVVLLVGGIALLVLDRRRRRSLAEVLA